jgi:DNA repair protein RecO (recombination protein O)
MALRRSDAIVLDIKKFRETSLVVNFFSEHFGKVSGLLKGARRPRSRFGWGLAPFSCNHIVFYESRGELCIVSQCDLKADFPGLRDSLEKISLASCLVELVDCLLPRGLVSKEIFELLKFSLEYLSSKRDNVKSVLPIFQVKILKLSGFKPHLDSCVSCQGKITINQARFSQRLGGILCKGCFGKDNKSQPLSTGTISSILYIENYDLRDALRLEFDERVFLNLEQLMVRFLCFHLERRFKSIDFLKEAIQFNLCGLN